MLRITRNVINLFLTALTLGRTHKITVVQGGGGGGRGWGWLGWNPFLRFLICCSPKGQPREKLWDLVKVANLKFCTKHVLHWMLCKVRTAMLLIFVC